ncbi:uncharacterized protein (TIGR00156 family) [Orbus hercynius]|uniref:Uncharacterized protein (TIGR00156 family) n=1 Tax=Orbus hercynius TaxID=593135 RepID=A0A495RC13_9GAMM|nr:NirD/YgiW/YdeI family stress tolerance protein [Orbus hercynius]RKS84800.1 uncharacterized protein (TIGR00156 family) [Orbus hercynius]
MKKFIPLIFIVCLGIANTVMAQAMPVQGGFISATSPVELNAGGFNADATAITTVAQVSQLADDAWVTLQGHIIKQVGDENYIFKDATGEINVEIDHKYWQGQTVTPNDNVEIVGEVDKDWGSIGIDVKRIRMLSVK